MKNIQQSDQNHTISDGHNNKLLNAKKVTYKNTCKVSQFCLSRHTEMMTFSRDFRNKVKRCSQQIHEILARYSRGDNNCVLSKIPSVRVCNARKVRMMCK